MSSCPSRAGEYRTTLGIGPGVFYSGACVSADGTTSELPVRMYDVYELLYQASTDLSCLDSAPLTLLSCLLFWDSFSVWYHLWRMTPRWRQVGGEKCFRSFSWDSYDDNPNQTAASGNRPASEKQINIHPSRHRLHITTLTRKPAKITHFASSIHQTEIQSSKRTFTSMPFFYYFFLN